MRKMIVAAALGAAALVTGAAPMPMIDQKAPEFTLPSDRGGNVSLSDFQGKQNVLLAFFPKAFTPG